MSKTVPVQMGSNVKVYAEPSLDGELMLMAIGDGDVCITLQAMGPNAAERIGKAMEEAGRKLRQWSEEHNTKRIDMEATRCFPYHPN